MGEPNDKKAEDITEIHTVLSQEDFTDMIQIYMIPVLDQLNNNSNNLKVAVKKKLLGVAYVVGQPEERNPRIDKCCPRQEVQET